METIKISDTLKAEWELLLNTGDYGNTEFLVDALADQFPNVPNDLLWEVAADWTGYEFFAV
jgi:hypothetical protein